ncbi:hypothetical protein GCM10008983_07480 [Lentibacillus halophilus]|uniref:Uncharacterized protein n=1 Tax=Lentibacillus halophilus TaxID=295065 RepID=A0ABN0Z4P9_9BACI
METGENEKAQRLQGMLEEALTSVTKKLDVLEQEIGFVRKEQKELKEMLERRKE